MAFTTDEILWYNNGVWGQLGYACPNFGDNPTTVNMGLAYLTAVMGRNLSGVMDSTDVDLRSPPGVNTIIKIHKLIIRARQIIAGRAVPPGTPQMEGGHVTPAPQDFIVYPVPYFLVRNAWMREYSGLVLACLSDIMQNTENRNAYDFSTTLGGRIGQYLTRIYTLMATELLQVPTATAAASGFVLTDAQIAAYDPSKWFTSTELIDTIPTPDQIPTEDDLLVLTNGIPATTVVGLQKWPTGGVVAAGGTTSATGTSGGTATATATAAAVPAFPAAPTP